MTDGLKEAHRTAIVDVLRANRRVERAVLFGSRAMETFTQGSDVDIALFGKALTTADQARLAAAMEELPVPQRVDLLLYDRIEDAALREHVRRDGIELYRKQENASAGRLIVPEAHRRTLASLLREHLPGVEVWAYGGRVNGRGRDGSALGLVLRGSGLEEIPSDRLAELEKALRESSIPFPVEARDWAYQPKWIRREIQREHVVLTEAPIRAKGSGAVRLGDCIVMNDAIYSPKESWPFVNYLDTGSITENRIEEFQRLTLGRDKLPSRARRKVKPGDIVYSTVRPNQKHFGLLQDVPENLLVSTGFSVFRGREGIADTRFIYWLLAQDHIVKQLHTIAEHSTSTYPSIRPADIQQLEIPLPSLPEQRAIAYVLGTLDDKIELNRRTNETLEAMARAIFKDWFVDFGPVRAKMEGRTPYLAPELWELFPDVLDNEDKPVGWNRGTLADVAESPRRSVNPTDVSENTPYIGLEHMPRRSIALSHWGAAGKVKSNKTQFHPGEILYGKLRPYFHKVGVASLEGICSTDIIVVVPQAQKWGAFTLACLSSDEFVHYTDRTSTGTKMPSTSWKTMAQYKICLPSEKVIFAFQSVVQPLLDYLSANIHATSTLAQTRDLLLPKLMSGEIRLRDAEKAVGAVA